MVAALEDIGVVAAKAASGVYGVLANDVREPIVMYEAKVLDGRNRYLAARECGRSYPTIEYEGDDPLAYIISLNLARRYLSESQRAMVAGKLTTMRRGERADLMPIGRMSQGDAD